MSALSTEKTSIPRATSAPLKDGCSHQFEPLLKELLLARGPVGLENEVAKIVSRELRSSCDEVIEDKAGNVTGIIRGQDSSKCVRLFAHMDELSMIVKRIEPDGTLIVRPLGNILPGVFGEGAVEIITDNGSVPAAMSFGCRHVTNESRGWDLQTFGANKPIDWNHVQIISRLDVDALAKSGVHFGSRVVIARSRRNVFPFADCLSSYFLDNRACLTAMLNVAASINRESPRPPVDLAFVGTVQEEIGGIGVTTASRHLAPGLSIALDVAPVAKEYGIPLDATPVVIYGDSTAVYSYKIIRSLVALARRNELPIREAYLQTYGSDAGKLCSVGGAEESMLLCIPTENTHGFEIIHKDSISQLATLLHHFLIAHSAEDSFTPSKTF